MGARESGAYRDIFYDKYKACKSKKDYKKLCKLMLCQFDMIDKVDVAQWRILSSILGEDTYAKILALSLKMCILEQEGISCDVLSVEDIEDL